MNNITKRNNGTSGMQRTQQSPAPLSGLLDGVLNRFLDDAHWGFNGLDHHRSVPVNIRETETSFDLEVVAPGLRKEDFHIQLDGKTLTVSMEREQEARNESEKGYLRQEYRVQSFTRSFELDDHTVDPEKINARYENGVLWLSLPKREEAQRQRRQIEIS